MSHRVREDVQRAANELGVSPAIPIETLIKGYRVEAAEHGSRDPRTNVTDDDPQKTLKIALAHLAEYPDYYERLERMEAEAAAALGGKRAPDPFLDMDARPFRVF